MPEGFTLNMGCGNDPRPSMLNVDRSGPGADVFMDASRLALKSGCVWRIVTHHLVEHLGWVGCTHAFCEWFRVMRPGAVLEIETPDLPESARQFVRADLARRGLLASWIYGKEGGAMEHRFCFEYDLLADLLRSCGFVRIRREERRTHPGLPGLRVVARRGQSMAQQIHARFKGILLDRGLAPGHQDLAVELHDEVAADLVRTMKRAGRSTGAADSMMARLVVHDPEIARAALDAAGSRLPASVVSRWKDVLAQPETTLTPRRLTGALLAGEVAPGDMQSTFQDLRDRARRSMKKVAAGSAPGLDLPGAVHTQLELRPFSHARLCLEAQDRTGRGLRAFACGRLDEAQHQLTLASVFNSNLPVTFWNLSRVATAAGRPAEAMAQLERAWLAARKTGSDLMPAIRQERALARSGKPIPSTPVSPVQPFGPDGP